MRYIRTKDGKIYELQKTKSGEKYLVKTNELIPEWNTEAHEVIKQADTIEELCDELVVCDPQLLLPFTRERIGGDLYLHPSFEEKFKEGKLEAVYGAIWTDKGLIYVAKMNEKGELELL